MGKYDTSLLIQVHAKAGLIYSKRNIQNNYSAAAVPMSALQIQNYYVKSEEKLLNSSMHKITIMNVAIICNAELSD